jgi:hypothetical protein
MRPRITDLHSLLLHESNDTNPMHPPNVDWEKNLVQNKNVTSPNNVFYHFFTLMQLCFPAADGSLCPSSWRVVWKKELKK